MMSIQIIQEFFKRILCTCPQTEDVIKVTKVNKWKFSAFFESLLLPVSNMFAYAGEYILPIAQPQVCK